jgi:uncharacterized protein (DUF2147 family)
MTYSYRQTGLFLFLLFFSISGLSADEKYLGLWKTIDDDTKEPKSIVQIYLENNKLSGKVVKVFPKKDQPKDPLCIKCKGDLHNAKIIGMQILKNMEFVKGVWKNGEILDPDNGKYYDCKIWIENGKLKVRGYIGFFFRTQEWLRVEEP